MSNKTIADMERLAVEFEAKAESLRVAIALVATAQNGKARASLPGKLKAATKQRTADRNGDGLTHTERMAGRRARAAAAFAALAEQPRSFAELTPYGGPGGVNKWAGMGFIKRGADGMYQLTAKGRRYAAELQQP